MSPLVSDMPTGATQKDLDDMSRVFHAELATLKEQIALLQARAASLEAQLAKIEPVIEARASRTEKLVMELQIEISKMNRFLTAHGEKETATYKEIKAMLNMLIAR